ncbi:MAG: protein phosphatase 2C domain-containing protein [Myxococcales bacterium]|nr:MAG: protein phosphatase 2C domain-containing protein [Myxococcales bacterium]
MAVDIIYDCMSGAPEPQDRDVFANRLVKAMVRAGERIFLEASNNRNRRGMGTTGTAAGLIDDTLFVAQVGDSRAYLLRDGKLSLITKDQSLVNQLIEAGQLTEEEAEAFEHSNIILQALGTTEEVQVDLTFAQLRQADRLLICSDGLSGLVHDSAIEEILHQEKDPRLACEKLIRLAHSGGGHDNITVIVADFFGPGLKSADDKAEVQYQQYPLPPDVEREGVPQTRKLRVDRAAEATEPIGFHDTVPVSGGPGVHLKRLGVFLISTALLGGLVFLLMLSWPSIHRHFFRNAGKNAISSGESSTMRPHDPAAELVEVRVRTDAEDALLYVDGERYGELPAQEDLSLLFPPGAYRFEARSRGSVVAATLVTVEPGATADVALNLPTGESNQVRRNQAPVLLEPNANPELQEVPPAEPYDEAPPQEQTPTLAPAPQRVPPREQPPAESPPSPPAEP